MQNPLNERGGNAIITVDRDLLWMCLLRGNETYKGNLIFHLLVFGTVLERGEISRRLKI
jgi:hypothetical protein